MGKLHQNNKKNNIFGFFLVDSLVVFFGKKWRSNPQVTTVKSDLELSRNASQGRFLRKVLESNHAVSNHFDGPKVWHLGRFFLHPWKMNILNPKSWRWMVQMIFLETLDFSVQKPFILRGVALYQYQLTPLTVASVGISVRKKCLGWPS